MASPPADRDPRPGIEAVARAWARLNPNAAAGGRYAIRGFQFQFHVTLLEAVDAWTRQPGPAPGFFAERLSDVVAEGDGVLVVTQAKRRGSSGAVSSALAELWSISCAAATLEAPPALRYRILCEGWDLKDVASAVDHWSPAGGAAPERLAGFRARVSWAAEPHPVDALMVRLVNRFRCPNPAKWILEWTGRLMDVGSSDRGPETFSRDLWNELHSLDAAERKLPAGIRLWDTLDRPRAAVEPGELLLGEQPRPGHLRQGYFAPRPSVYDPIADRISDWLNRATVGSDRAGRLPVYWIGGRSGCGKSVALLHVLASLNRSGAGPILWLGNYTALLPAAFEWASQVAAQGERPIIALDDPYTPEQEGSAGSAWVQTIAASLAAREEGRVPLVVCCGPTEQGTRFRDAFPDDVVLTTDVVPPGLDEAEIAALRRWFRERRGTDAPELGTGDLLPVQLFFEWRTGEPLPAFGKRFRERIRSLAPNRRLDTLLGTLFAANRLYADLPFDALATLTPAERDGIEHLLHDHHLMVREGAHGPTALRIAHPHIANAIFEAWYPRSQVHERTAVVLDAVGLALRYGASPSERTAPLWGLARALAPATPAHVRERVDALDLRRLVDGAWGLAAELGAGSVPTDTLPVFVELEALLPGGLSSPVLDTARARLASAAPTETGLRLLCHKLLEHSGRWSPEVAAAIGADIHALLTRAPSWREWPNVATDLVRHRHSPGDGALLLTWVRGNVANRDAPVAFTFGVREFADGAAPWDLVCAILAVAPRGAGWANAIWGLAETEGTPPSVLAAAAGWVGRHGADVASAYPMLALSKHGYSMLGPARAWLDRWYGAPGTEYAFEVLLGPQVPDAAVQAMARAWIRPELPRIDRILQRLLELDPDDRATAAIATSWLGRTSLRYAGWTYVVEALLQTPAADQVAVHAQAVRWLAKTASDDTSWSHLWRHLWRRRPTLRLAALALRWLGRTDDKTWTMVWDLLWRAAPGNDGLIRLAEGWLQRTRTMHGWADVWWAVRKARPEDPDLGPLAEEFLEVTSINSNWARIWRHADPTGMWLPAVEEWLGRNRNHPDWHSVWGQFAAKEESGVAARRMGLTRLRASLTSRAWVYIWAALWTRRPGDPELTALAWPWLEQTPTDSGWGLVWDRLETIAADPGRLLALVDAHRLLLVENPSFGSVLTALHRRATRPDGLADTARAWLGRFPTHRDANGVREAFGLP